MFCVTLSMKQEKNECMCHIEQHGSTDLRARGGSHMEAIPQKLLKPSSVHHCDMDDVVWQKQQAQRMINDIRYTHQIMDCCFLYSVQFLLPSSNCKNTVPHHIQPEMLVVFGVRAMMGSSC